MPLTRGINEGDVSTIGVGPGPEFPLYYKTTSKTSAYTTSGESVIFVDPSGGAFTLTLSSEDAAVAGHFKYIWNTTTSTNAVTLDTEGSETINGAASIAGPNASRECIMVVSDGTNWFAVQSPIPS